MKKYLKDNVPKMPEHYERCVDRTLEQLTNQHMRTESPNKAMNSMRRAVLALGGCAAALSLCITGFFTAFPSYAADIPVLNRIIYAISPVVRESSETQQEVARTTSRVLKEFMESDIVLYTGEEQISENWQLNTSTIRSAYYFKDRILRQQNPRKLDTAEITIEITSVDTFRKGYEIRGTLLCEILADGTPLFQEHIDVILVERPHMLTVVGMYEAAPDIE